MGRYLSTSTLSRQGRGFALETLRSGRRQALEARAGGRGPLTARRGTRYADCVPLVNHSQRELHIKIVYYGPGLGGKTTNLEHIHGKSRREHRGKLISLATEAERTLFFDLLPMHLGDFRGYRVRLHLCTVPGQIAFDHTRRLVLRHVDGVVFVVDSQDGRVDQNIESINNLYDNLRLQGDDPDRMPLVVQYNKRDLDMALPIDVLREELRIPEGVPQVAAVAINGVGVFETLKHATKACLRIVGDPVMLTEGRSPSILPGSRASMYRDFRPPSSFPHGIPMTVPGAPRVPDMANIAGSHRDESEE